MATGGGSEAVAQRILRMTDIDGEPLEFRAPISGYAKVPFVSLEEAVEPLVVVLPDVQSHAYVAKQRCKKPADGLSSDESAAIMLYTMGWEPLDECLYVVLNNTLRSKDRQQELKPWYLYLRLFLNALSRLPPCREVTYRGVKLNISEKYVKGETIVWWSFSSSTTVVEVLQSNTFLGETGPRTMFTIQCETARDIHRHSYYPAENELLLLAATQFQVTGSLKQGDLCIIHLKETRPPHPLLQPVPIVYQTNNSSPTEPKPAIPIINTTIAAPSQSTQAKLPRPTYHNVQLEELITEQKGETEMNLNNGGWTDADMEIMAYYALKENETLTALNLGSNRIEHQGAQHLSDAIRQNKTLTTLNLSNNQIRDEGTQHLSDTLRQNEALTSLHLWGNEIGPQGAQSLSDALQQNTTLTTLNLSNNQIGDTGAQHLSDALRQNKTLTTVELSNNQIGGLGAQHLSDALRQNETLTTLNLSNNQIGDEGGQHLGDALQQNKTLTTLRLWGNEIGVNGAQRLSDALRQNKTLTTLDLWNNQIGAEGAQYLSDALQQNTTLITLNLENNEIGDEGAQHLSDALRENKTLSTLNLLCNKIGDQGKEHLSALEKTNPHLKITL